MIDLAISIDDDAHGVTIVETNHGEQMVAPRWPQDRDSRLVAFAPQAKECDVISPSELAHDIAQALEALETVVAAAGRKPKWYHRLSKCAAGAPGS